MNRQLGRLMLKCRNVTHRQLYRWIIWWPWSSIHDLLIVVFKLWRVKVHCFASFIAALPVPEPSADVVDFNLNVPHPILVLFILNLFRRLCWSRFILLILILSRRLFAKAEHLIIFHRHLRHCLLINLVQDRWSLISRQIILGQIQRLVSSVSLILFHDDAPAVLPVVRGVPLNKLQLRLVHHLVGDCVVRDHVRCRHVWVVVTLGFGVRHVDVGVGASLQISRLVADYWRQGPLGLVSYEGIVQLLVRLHRVPTHQPFRLHVFQQPGAVLFFVQTTFAQDFVRWRVLPRH